MKIYLQNLGTVNKNRLSLSNEKGEYIDIYFSYETPVSIGAMVGGEHYKATRQNDWGNTTGKLLNECQPDKSKRITEKAFEQVLSEVLSKFN